MKISLVRVSGGKHGAPIAVKRSGLDVTDAGARSMSSVALNASDISYGNRGIPDA